MHQACEQWVGVINGQTVAHVGMIQFPMRKGWKRVHRLVVLPDYQGIGIGVRFMNEIARHYAYAGWNVNLTTTTPALVHALAKDINWSLVRHGRVKNTLQKNLGKYYSHKRADGKPLGSSDNRITYSSTGKRWYSLMKKLRAKG